MIGAVIAAGTAAAASGLYGAYKQSKAAEEAAKQQRELGEKASGIIGESYGDALKFLYGGAEEQQRYLGQAGGLMARGVSDAGALGQRLDERWAGQRQAGDAALAQLQAALLGGDTSGFTQSPGYKFQLEQGQKAIERAAAAAGSFGGGANLKDLTRFGQGLASQEYGNYVNRLMGLQQIGAQATAQSAQTALGVEGLRSSLLGAQAGYLGQQGAVQGALGNNLAALRTGTAANQANALTGAGSQAIQYQLAGDQAWAQGLTTAGNSIQQMMMLAALTGGSEKPVGPLSVDRGIRTTSTVPPPQTPPFEQVGMPMSYGPQYPWSGHA